VRVKSGNIFSSAGRNLVTSSAQLLNALSTSLTARFVFVKQVCGPLGWMGLLFTAWPTLRGLTRRIQCLNMKEMMV
jgi:hypothetical protein